MIFLLNIKFAMTNLYLLHTYFVVHFLIFYNIYIAESEKQPFISELRNTSLNAKMKSLYLGPAIQQISSL